MCTRTAGVHCTAPFLSTLRGTTVSPSPWPPLAVFPHTCLQASFHPCTQWHVPKFSVPHRSTWPPPPAPPPIPFFHSQDGSPLTSVQCNGTPGLQHGTATVSTAMPEQWLSCPVDRLPPLWWAVPCSSTPTTCLPWGGHMGGAPECCQSNQALSIPVPPAHYLVSYLPCHPAWRLPSHVLHNHGMLWFSSAIQSQQAQSSHAPPKTLPVKVTPLLFSGFLMGLPPLRNPHMSVPNPPSKAVVRLPCFLPHVPLSKRPTTFAEPLLPLPHPWPSLYPPTH